MRDIYLALTEDNFKRTEIRKSIASGLYTHSKSHRQKVTNRLNSLVFTSSEIVTSTPFHTDIFCIRDMTFINRLRCVAVDEAHLVEDWGQDFRKAYSEIGPIRRYTGEIPFYQFLQRSLMPRSKAFVRNVILDLVRRLRFEHLLIGQRSFSIFKSFSTHRILS